MKIIRSEEAVQQYISMFDMTSFLNNDLLRNLQLFQFPAHTNIYIEQAEQSFLFFLVEGQVQCTHYHMNGKLVVVALLNPFTAIGDLEILSEERMNTNVITSQMTTMLGIAKATVQRFGMDDPRFLHFLIDQLREKLYETNSLQRGRALSAKSQLALYILAHSATHEGNTVTLPDKETLASLLGTTQRHLNRVIKELVVSGGIDHGYPSVHIFDRFVLQEFIEN